MPRAATDHVVQEAPVGEEIVRVGEGPDEGIGQQDTADDVVREPLFKVHSQRSLEQRLPGVVVAEMAAEAVATHERFRQRREHPPGDPAGQIPELLPCCGILPEAAAGGNGIGLVDEDARVPDRRVRRHSPAAQRDVQTELLDDQRWEQAHEIGVLRQVCPAPGEHPLRSRRATERRGALQHEHGPAGASEIGSASQAVVPAADHDGVVRSVHSSRTVP